MEQTPPIGQAVVSIPLGCLRAHPANSNVMKPAALKKLAGHIRATGRYPPLIVRPMAIEADAYEVLDGHHRWQCLAQLGHEQAMCVVWAVDDEQALVLLSTLNRLEGADDPLRRSALLRQLTERFGRKARELSKLLPETAGDVKKLLAAGRGVPKPRPAPPLSSMRQAVHFFLLPEEKRRLDRALGALDANRERALMKLVATGDEDGREGTQGD
jgi:ParB-like chromosome segregation protein Spo0J